MNEDILMNAEAMRSALNKIHKIAESTLSEEMSPETKKKLALILSIAQYQFDVSSDGEQPKKA